MYNSFGYNYYKVKERKVKVNGQNDYGTKDKTEDSKKYEVIKTLKIHNKLMLFDFILYNYDTAAVKHPSFFTHQDLTFSYV